MNTEDLILFLSVAVTVFQVLVAVIALLFYKKYKDTPLKYLYIIFLYGAVNEMVGSFVGNYLGYNAFLYNIYNTLFFFYFYYVFLQYVQKTNHKNWIFLCFVIFTVACLVNPFFESYITRPQLFAYIVGACLLIFCIILYFIEVLTTSKILHINQDLLFWVSVGLLLFYVGYLPIKITRLFFADKQNLLLTIKAVQLLLIIIMNSCFIIGFLWMKKKSPPL